MYGERRIDSKKKEAKTEKRRAEQKQRGGTTTHKFQTQTQTRNKSDYVTTYVSAAVPVLISYFGDLFFFFCFFEFSSFFLGVAVNYRKISTVLIVSNSWHIMSCNIKIVI